ncbi:MAG: AzlD domain-containing protein [Ilumatobacter sp.]|uniref:AzlD domain-containing protein n=1 Tax=Ilumatobacter sp. TaxID=1967498 RepID=UPI002619AC9B|nr:AzlD domain-containing protein [Ilumatobacter sp.]MDJ0771784.1 AzlD domain-containing protein [Ilumatobacter sp.]
MSTAAALAIVAGVAVMTYVMRAIGILALAGRRLPLVVERALRNVGPAVLAALTVSLAAGGEGGPDLELAEAASLIVAGGVAWWRRNIIWTLLAGMVTLWVLTALL